MENERIRQTEIASKDCKILLKSVLTRAGYIHSISVTDKKSNLSFGIMSRNPLKVQKWLKNHLTK
jgi:hypothetical protein